jgi:cell wall-associated NlpC family hydrolase
MTVRRLATALTLAVAGAGSLRAQAVVDSRAKPFAAFSASAERLRDSVRARMGSVFRIGNALPVVVPAAEVTAWRDSIASAAREQLGIRYRLGAESPSRGFDCSGLVQFVLALFDVDLPRTAQTQSRMGRAVQRDPDQLLPGDLLTFGAGKRVTHIGIYVGDGLFIHASPAGRRVVESSIEQKGTWYRRNWVGVRRLLAADSSHFGG